MADTDNDQIDERVNAFIAQWRETGGSEIANTQSFINGLCNLLNVPSPDGSMADDARNDYVFERGVFQDNGDGTQSFGRIDCYKRGCFVLEAKQGSAADRSAADRGEDDLDLFGQTAATRVKRGTARRGTDGWVRAMIQAKGQAERYAKALPIDHGWPPILMVADIGYCLEVYADFSGSGKAYAQFPDRARYRIMLEDLRHKEVRDRLRDIWTEPMALDPTAKAARVTRDIADLLATVARRIEKRGSNAEKTSGFLMRLLFTMFAEDSGLIPEGSFTDLLKGQRDHPEHLADQLSALWQAMDKGGFAPALGVPVRTFNGYLFKDTSAIPLDAEELEVLISAAEHKWQHVEPAIFGTLLERALNPKERAKLGAHYTPRAYVERLIGPTIMEPLRGEWDAVRASAAALIEEGKTAQARKDVEAFHARLAQTKVLDPACGTGNFLYVAMARMKELEGEVLDLLVELGDQQYVAEITGHTITPENFLGIEINPRAAAIAQLVLWIGYLQWHFRVNGRRTAPPEPILKDIRTIENRDALLDYDAKQLKRDDDGKPVTRWDGETMKLHPVTGKKVPDETARVEAYCYDNPRPASWPKADFIVGNPPFIGSKRIRDQLGDGYFEAVRQAFPKLPGDIDLVIYWWAIGAAKVSEGEVRRSGLITTNTLRQSTGQKVIAKALNGRKSASLVFAVGDHPWRDVETDAAVRVSMTVVAKGRVPGSVYQVDSGSDASLIDHRYGWVHEDLTIGVSTTDAVKLRANQDLSFMGVKLAGAGFRITGEEREKLIEAGASVDAMPILLAGSDITGRPQGRYVIDVFGHSEEQLREVEPALYQHLFNTVRPGRATLKRKSYRDLWWIFAEPRPAMRSAIAGLGRVIVTSEVSKHPTFAFAPTADTQFDGSLIVIASDQPWVLGVLSSRFHSIWKHTAGGALEDRPRYQVGTCFDPFPFPDCSQELALSLAAEAEALDGLRRQVLSDHEDLTLTKLYNALDLLRSGREHSASDTDIHDRGLVSLVKQHHDAIDALVAEAYKWPVDLSDEDILSRLVALNKERAAEEANGLIRWLRPDYQAPDYQAPVDGTLDLGEAAAPVLDNVIAWPETLPERFSAVQAILASAEAPLAAQDVARTFKGKRAATVRPVLDALTGIGMARRLEDGRYAA
ncbi:class I SAM-dependent DNA methyltransferase [Sphingomicrobium nitratireducens]|uniref:class I SAM-dependent DNA methyltransferase n=1 Tax=Sphingomicrobium nitratireducens TaxID=2964666 RepID=UPI00223FF20E|nr:DNA methyltransferase [Sphingomicrobium nitratireducens]